MPYPNFHAARVRNPDDFVRIRTKKLEHDGKEYTILLGPLKSTGKVTVQAYRYPKETWTVEQARAHSKSHGAKGFEAATNKKEEREIITESLKLVQEQSIDNSTNIDRENWIIRNVAILGRYSPNVSGGRKYLDSALDSAVSVLEGIKAFEEHSYGKRVFRELVGVFRNVRRDGDRVRADLHLLDKGNTGQKLMTVAEEAPDAVGFSIDADVAYKNTMDEGEEIHKIVSGRSVDLVMEPATTKGIFEEQENQDLQETKLLEEIETMEIKELQEEIKELKTKLDAEEIEKKKAQEDLKQAQEELNTYRLKEQESKKKSVIEEKVKAANLPDWLVTEVFTQSLLEAKEEQVDRLIDDRKKILEAQGQKYQAFKADPGGSKTDEKTEEISDEEAKKALS